MLNVMRKHAGSWMIKVILFAIVIVFVFWGVGSFRSREASKVASVNDEIISLADYRRSYNNLIDQYRRQFGASLNEDMIEMLQLKKQALDQLIDRAIILQEAKKLDLRVSDDEVADAIMKSQAFHRNGAFDSRRYHSILAQVNITAEEYEADQKNALLAEKLTRLITNAAKVPDAEIRQWYDWQNQTVNVDYVFFKSDDYTDIKPTEKEITDYFEAHKESYKTEPKIKTRYVVFDPAAYKQNVTVSDDDIKAYYDDNPNEFNIEKTVEARHILFKVDQGADEKTDQEAKAKADAVYKLAKGGEDFAELAKQHSEGPTKDQGGYLGSFKRAQMVKPFADKAFSMAAGEISEPVKTRYGWHLIKVESIQEATTKTLEESKTTITEKLETRDARNQAYDAAVEFFESCFEKDDLVKNAKALNLTVAETEPFDRQGPEALANGRNAFATAAFALNPDEISDVQDIDGKYYILQMTETIDAKIPALDAVEIRVEADLVKSMQTNAAQQDAQAMAAELKAGGAFDDIAAARGLTVKQTGAFKRNGAIPEIGNDRKIAAAAFELASVGDISREPIPSTAGFYLLRLKEKSAPPEDGFESQKDAIKARLQQQKQRTVFEEWVEARKATSRITTEKAYLE